MKRSLGTARCFLRLPFLVPTHLFFFFFSQQNSLLMGTNTNNPTENFSRNNLTNYTTTMKAVYRKHTRKENHQKITEKLLRSSSSRFTEKRT